MSGLRVRRNDANVRAAFWHVTHILRQLASDVADWVRMFPGSMARLLPLHLALSGPRQAIPILRTSGAATPARIWGVNWRKREFFVENTDELSGPFFYKSTLKAIFPTLNTSSRLGRFFYGVNLPRSDHYQCDRRSICVKLVRWFACSGWASKSIATVVS